MDGFENVADRGVGDGLERSFYYGRAMDRMAETDISDDEAEVQRALENLGFRLANPYRAKTAKSIDSGTLVDENRNTLARCTVMIANLSVSGYPYVGIWFEIAEAFAFGIPVVAWVGSTGYEQHHYLRVHCEFIGQDVDSVITYLARVWTDDGLAAHLAESKAYYEAVANTFRLMSNKRYAGGKDAQYQFERTRLEETLVERCQGKRVLELGCGDGGWTTFILRSASMVRCIDSSALMIDAAKRRLVPAATRLEFIQGDFLDATTRLDGFDVVVAYFLLGFLPRGVQNHLLRRMREECDIDATILFAESVRHAELPASGLDAVRLQRRAFEGRNFVICKEVFSTPGLSSRVARQGLKVIEVLEPSSWFSFCSVRVERSQTRLAS